MNKTQLRAINTIKCYVMMNNDSARSYAQRVLEETLAACKTEAAKQAVTAAAKKVGL